jgi:hypothetical protein
MILDKFSQRMLQYEILMAQRGCQLHVESQTCGESFSRKGLVEIGPILE